MLVHAKLSLRDLIELEESAKHCEQCNQLMQLLNRREREIEVLEEVNARLERTVEGLYRDLNDYRR